jgi:phage terminase small subunit
MKLTQPVMLQSFTNEFGVKKDVKANLPAKPGQILIHGDGNDVLDEETHTKYRLGVGKLHYLATWLRPDTLNAVREVSRQLKALSKVHNETMIHVMKFCVNTAN